MADVEFLTIAISIFALIINIYGLVVAFIADSKFHGGLNKQIVRIVFVLVVLLNIHIILNVYSNIIFQGTDSLHIALDHIGFILVIIISILAIIASLVNYKMAREQGFA